MEQANSLAWPCWFLLKSTNTLFEEKQSPVAVKTGHVLLFFWRRGSIQAVFLVFFMFYDVFCRLRLLTSSKLKQL